MAISNNPINPGRIPANLHISGAEPVAVPAKSAPAAKPAVATGISSVNAGLTAAIDDRFNPDKIAAQMGLDVRLSDAGKKYIDSLNPTQMQGLQGVQSAFTAAVTNNTGRGSANIDMPDALQSRWADFVTKTTGGSKSLPTDVNALVQWVLRESYMETTKDLYFYAEKVKFFNNCKKAIRDEMTRARDEMVKYAGKEDSEALAPPFMPNPVATDFVGGTDVTSDPNAAAAANALQAAQDGLTAGSSGSGVKQLTAAEKAALSPPGEGDVFFTVDKAGNPLYRIDSNPPTVKIYSQGADGQSALRTTIWGDPHVNEGGGGDAWHFGSDSTFILPDGSKLSLNTAETSPGSGIYYTVGVDVLSGNQRGHSGTNLDGSAGTAGVSNDRGEFDAKWTDSNGTASGVFGLQANGEWAVKCDDGQFRDIKNMSWDTYLTEHKVVADGPAVSMSEAQQLAAQDATGGLVANVDAATATAEGYGLCTTKGELDAYIQKMEEKLNSVGDDAQLANVDLQNILQKQQQTIQMMSNISKMLNDTALAIIRKIGG
jgi:hypothetical protein